MWAWKPNKGEKCLQKLGIFTLIRGLLSTASYLAFSSLILLRFLGYFWDFHSLLQGGVTELSQLCFICLKNKYPPPPPTLIDQRSFMHWNNRVDTISGCFGFVESQLSNETLKTESLIFRGAGLLWASVIFVGNQHFWKPALVTSFYRLSTLCHFAYLYGFVPRSLVKIFSFHHLGFDSRLRFSYLLLCIPKVAT